MEKQASQPSQMVKVSQPATAPARSHRVRDLMPWRWGRRNGESIADPLESLQHAMNHLLESFRLEIGAPLGKGDLGMVSPKLDVGETEDAYEFTVELPGMDEKNIDVSVTDDALTIRGEKKTETSEKKKDYHYQECSYGSVERVVSLPDGVDTDKVAAKFRNGVLTVTVPKTAEARRQARKIPVQG